MSDGKKYYCFCGSNCKYETMTKEQILAAIAQAVATGSVGDCDTGFITKVKETNMGGYVTFWVGTREQYNAIKEHAKDCFYIITDDTTDADILATITEAVVTSKKANANAEIAVASMEAINNTIVKMQADITPVDFSDNVRLYQRYDGDYPNFTITDFSTKEYVYIPTLRMVFFNIDMIITGKMKAGDVIRIGFIENDTNGSFFKPRRSSYTYPVTSRSVRFSAEHLPDEISIRVNEAIDAEGISDSIGLSGWYFCD